MLTARSNHLSNQLTAASLAPLLFFALCFFLSGCSTTSKETASSRKSEPRKELAPVWQAPVAGMEKKEESSVVIHDLSFTYNKLIASADENAAKALAETMAAEKHVSKKAVAEKPVAKKVEKEKPTVSKPVAEKNTVAEKAPVAKPRTEEKISAPKQIPVPSVEVEKITAEKILAEKSVTAPTEEKKILAEKPVAKAKSAKAKSGKAVQISAQAQATEEVYFTIQFLTYDTQLRKGHEKLKGITDFQVVTEGRFYKYFTGKTKTFESASDLQYSLRAQGFRDAFIVAFKNGNKIPVLDAIRDLSMN